MATDDAEAAELRRFVADLQERRIRLDMNLRKVEASSGIDIGTLSRIETGKIPSPSMLSLMRFARSLGMPIELPRLPEGPARRDYDTGEAVP